MRLVFLTGSGVSADSGIPTFRGAGGLYEGWPAEALLSADGLRRHPQLVHQFMADRRRAMADAVPNAAHVAIADAVTAHPGSLVLTQNIDLLHERAGTPPEAVVHLHGRIDQTRCLGHDHLVPVDADGWPAGDGPATGDPSRTADEPRCPTCRSRLRPDVVLFGEHAPNYQRLKRTLAELRAGDLLVVAGTQGTVIPIGQVLPYLPCRKVLVNLHESDALPLAAFDHVRMGHAAAELPGFLAEFVGRGPDRPDRTAAADEPSPSSKGLRQRANGLWRRLRG